MSSLKTIVLSLSLITAAWGQGVVKNADGSWTSAGGWGDFNNPLSAAIDGQLLRMQRQSMLFQTMVMQEMFNEQWRTIGRKVIDEGKATTALTALDERMAERIIGYRAGDALPAAERAALVSAMTDDLKAAAGIIRHVGGDPSDLCDLLATTVLVGYEQYRSAKTTPAQLHGLQKAFRDSLLVDPHVQGQGVIGRELMAGKFASAIAAADRLRTAGDAAASRQAGGALLQSLWATPIQAIEPTESGFIDRGNRIVAAGQGSAAFTPAKPLDDFAAEAVKGLYFNLAFDADEAAHAKARQDWCASWIAEQNAFAAHVAKLRLPRDNLAAIATAATEMLWPAIRENEKIDANAVKQLLEVFTHDIANDPAFQRLDDTERQQVAIRWISRAADARRKLASREKAASLRAEKLDNADAMNALVRQSEIGVLDANVALGKANAAALLSDLFAPRKLDTIKQRRDGLFELKPIGK